MLRTQPEDDDLIARARDVAAVKTSKIGVVRLALREFIGERENGGDSGESE